MPAICFVVLLLSTTLQTSALYDELNIKIKQIIQSIKQDNKLDPDIRAAEISTLQQILELKPDINEDAKLNITQLSRKYGYEVEEYKVETIDGYILTVHRIPREGPVVFLMHGILLSSVDWITVGPKALAYTLSSAGFDVWMGNARGNRYSKNNVKIPTSDKKFWDFSWDEIGRYDIPAMIDFILTLTGQKKLSYIGFSQGTTTFFVMCSENPEYNDKVALSVALSPIAWISNAKSPIFRAVSEFNIFELLASLGIYEFLPFEFSYYLFSKLCTNDKISLILCSNFAFSLFGFGRGQLNVTNLPVLFGHMPAGCALKQLIHYEQLLKSGRFRQFDYGEKKNLQLYGLREPPGYDLKKITAPVALFYSDSDWLSNVTDVLLARGMLRNVVDFHFVKSYSHINYMFGNNAKEFVYDKIVELIKKYVGF